MKKVCRAGHRTRRNRVDTVIDPTSPEFCLLNSIFYILNTSFPLGPAPHALYHFFIHIPHILW
jgi:hypothetical protein